MSSRWKKRSSEIGTLLIAGALGLDAVAAGGLSAAETTALAADVKLFAESYACNEEPQAERLRATVLLLIAGSGKDAVVVAEARQRFLDGLRERMREPAHPEGCAFAQDAMRTRLAELERLRLAPPVPR
ncbi:MAG: hypothetical protein ABI794_05215 [Betaproteobacteria bacterium]